MECEKMYSYLDNKQINKFLKSVVWRETAEIQLLFCIVYAVIEAPTVGCGASHAGATAALSAAWEEKPAIDWRRTRRESLGENSNLFRRCLKFTFIIALMRLSLINKKLF